jgi:glycosyltransferase involved in cell wall biosynthesis
MVVLRDKFGLRPQLICTGGAREAQGELQKQIEESGLRQRVRFLGYCPAEDLPALYRAAGCLVFPSLFEGFGMPVLEAMACGCPVVCSNTSSLPEIAGEAALQIDPTEPEALAHAIQTLLREPELRRRLIALGLERASLFSWRRHTLETVEVLYRLHTRLHTQTRRSSS